MDEINRVEETPVSILLREYRKDEDEGFIYSSWRNSSYYLAFSRPSEPNSVYFRQKTFEIRQILERARVLMACFSDSPSMFLGYVVYTGTHLNWIYVKEEFRKMGIGRLLYPKCIETVTGDVTKIGAEIIKSHDLKVGENEDGEERET